MISLLKFVGGPWEVARGYLLEDLEHIESAINQRWGAVFNDDNTIDLDGDVLIGVLPIESGGTGNSTFTEGKVPYFDGTKLSDSGLTYDATNSRLGIGISSPSTTLHVDEGGTILDSGASNVAPLLVKNDGNTVFQVDHVEGADTGLEIVTSFASAVILRPVSAQSNAALTFSTKGSSANFQFIVPSGANPTISAQSGNVLTVSRLTQLSGDGNIPLVIFSDDSAGGQTGIELRRSSRTSSGNNSITKWTHDVTEIARLTTSGRLGLGTAAPATTISIGGANGQQAGFHTLTELTTIAAAATTDTTIQMPAGAIILSVSVRVTTVIPTATTFEVGDSGNASRFNTASVSTAATSTDAGTKAGAYYNAGALSVRITPDATPAANTGRVRVTILYYLSTPPTS